MTGWFETAVPAFATLFVVIDPVGLLPMFMALTQGMDARARHRCALRAILFGLAILVSFALFGKSILSFLGISLPAFRIAGGMLLFLLALEMLFEKRSERRQRNADQASGESTGGRAPGDDLWVFPLGTPLIAGPGAITSLILLMDTSAGKPAEQIVIIAVLAGVLLLALVLFLISGQLGRIAGPSATRAMTRILGIILAALSVQFVLTGLSQAGFGGNA